LRFEPPNVNRKLGKCFQIRSCNKPGFMREARMVEIVKLRKGERLPAKPKAVIIKIISDRGVEWVKDSPIAMQFGVRRSSYDDTVKKLSAKMEHLPAARIYVRES